jgi:GNAT superfamily N-acetyltransferase
VIDIIRTNSQNKDFIELVKFLDADLADRDGEEHAFYDQFNKIDTIKHCLITFENDRPVACGALKQFEFNTMEIKRMYVLPEHRGKKIAQNLLLELENWAKELGNEKCVLETGKKQPEAISLYKKCGYKLVANYGQYAGIENSVCFEKSLI